MSTQSPSIFDKAFVYLLQNEGHYSADKKDPGGATNLGISQRFITENKLPYDVKTLTLDEAKNIYKQYFWDKYNFNAITRSLPAIKIFDAAVNIGPKTAIKLAQTILSCTPDGMLGPKTNAALNKTTDSSFMKAYALVLVQHYDELVEENTDLHVFFNGWVKRANRLPTA